MSHSATHTQGAARGRKAQAYTATVATETDLASAVTVSGNGYTVSFGGNNFATKHLRRIRRNSVSELKNPMLAAAKLTEYITEAKDRSVDRWEGKSRSTNSLVFLDLEQYCQLGCQIIEHLKAHQNDWAPYPAPPAAATCQQQHVDVTLRQCLAYSHAGDGLARTDAGGGKVQGGVGVALHLTVRHTGNPVVVEVCHYAGGNVQGKFKSEYGDKDNVTARASIARNIVT